MKVGYWISSHVAQNHIATPILIQSMLDCGIDPAFIVVAINGSAKDHRMQCKGVRYLFRTPEFLHHLSYCANEAWGVALGVTHWFFLNTTSRCGPKFKVLIESGFDPKVEACSATKFMLPCTTRGKGGRPINDMAMYRDDFLVRIKTDIATFICTGKRGVEIEGMTFALANTQGFYPVTDRIVTGPTDIYGTGTPRITEYYPGIDWYRYKKNWGQLVGGEYDPCTL